MFAAMFILSVGKLWLADRYGRSTDPRNWVRAARLEPRNPAYWHQLGVYEEWDVARGSLSQASDHLKRAAALDPWSDANWMDLANIDEALGNTKATTADYRQAEWAYPASPQVSWQFGSFLLRQKDFLGASAHLRRALAADPNLTAPALALCTRTGQPLSSIFRDILPTQKVYYLAALDYFVSQTNPDAALESWHRLLTLKTPLPMSASFPLLEETIHTGRIAQASQIWQQALHKSNWPANNAQNASLVFNGGFEHHILDGGFDWRVVPMPGVTFKRDSSIAHAGKRAMRITFDGTLNLDFQNFYELVPIEPGHQYHFSAYLRTRGISTDSGIGFVVFDPLHCSAPQRSTSTLIGTHPWTLLAANISTAPGTNLIEIALRRKPSEKFDNKLSGTVWVDDVTLVPLATGKKRGSS
ncbi:MAG: tetratricopeptide repeat protein [Candidatus Acidiferrales bacterium]